MATGDNAVLLKPVDGYLNVAGRFYHVCGAVIKLDHNGIPTAVVSVDPLHSSDSADDFSAATSAAAVAIPTATRTDVNALLDTYNAIHNLANDRQERYCRLVINFIGRGEANASQSLDLDGWIVEGAGISMRFGSMSVDVSISHPASVLEEDALFAHGSVKRATAALAAVEAADNVLAGAVAALTAINNTAENTDAEHVAVVRQRAIRLLEAMANLLVYDEAAPKWPEKPLIEIRLPTVGIKRALAKYVASAHGATPWSWLSTGLFGDWGLSLRQTYWLDTLTVTPYRPWESPSISIRQADVASVQYPPGSAYSICGCYADTSSSNMPSGAFSTLADAIMKRRGSGGIHLEQVIGKLMRIGVPTWFSDAVMTARDILDTAYGGILGAASGSRAAEADPAINTDAAVSLMCRQAFSVIYRRDTQVVLNCRLMLNCAGGIAGRYIAPGWVAQVVPEAAVASSGFGSIVRDGLGSGGAPEVNSLSDSTASVSSEPGHGICFFVTQVTHTIDCNAATASTAIGGAYVHSPGNPNLLAIQDGIAPNYLYDDTADDIQDAIGEELVTTRWI